LQQNVLKPESLAELIPLDFITERRLASTATETRVRSPYQVRETALCVLIFDFHVVVFQFIEVEKMTF
jgi:hypothetical protein